MPPSVTVFTPTHHPQYLDECLASLHAQKFQDWEWIVLLNDGARWRPESPDDRVRIEIADDVSGVGAAKARACALAQGEYLVELDHDDLLAPHALESIVAEFETSPEVVFVYSHSAQILPDGTRDHTKFNEAAGWHYREAVVCDRPIQYAVSLAPTPHNVSYIWYAPNHVRAFRRAAYEIVGGYDATQHVLDDQDLMCRLYAAGEFSLIDDCLYLQRMHQRNTQRDADTNAFIQTETVALYGKYVEQNALAWAARNNLLALDFGAAHAKPRGYLGVDQYPGEGVDIVASLPHPLDLPDGSVGVIRAVDFMEHVTDKVALINEFHRLLAPDGLLLSMTPSTDGRGAFQDPTHVAFYNENSFWYYTDKNYRDYVPGIAARFQVSRLATYFPSDWHKQHDISYVQANLICLKDGGSRNGGQLLV